MGASLTCGKWSEPPRSGYNTLFDQNLYYFFMKKASLIITDLLLKLLHKRSCVTKFIQNKTIEY